MNRMETGLSKFLGQPRFLRKLFSMTGLNRMVITNHPVTFNQHYKPKGKSDYFLSQSSYKALRKHHTTVSLSRIMKTDFH